HFACKRRFMWKDDFPNATPIFLVRKRVLDNEAKTTDESVVQVLAQIGGQDRDSFVLLHLLQQIPNFNVCVAVVRILNFRALARESVSCVEEENRVARLGLQEDVVQVLFSLADVF